MSLRWHLVRLVLVALVPVVALATALIWVLVQQERATRQQAMQDVARSLALSVDSELQRSIAALEVLALSTRLANGDLVSFRARAERTLRLQQRWSNLVVFDAQGAQVLNLDVPEGQPLPRLPHVETVHEAVRTGRPQVSNLVRGTRTGTPLSYISVPVFAHGEVRYVLEAVIYFDVWTEWLQARIPAGWVAAIDDREGIVLARSEGADRFVGRQANEQLRAMYAQGRAGRTQILGLPGVRVYVAFHQADFSGWRALTVVPAEALDQGPFLTGFAWAAGSLAVVAAAAFFAAWNARRVTRDIGLLTRAIEQLGAGVAPAPVSSDIAEVGVAGVAAANAGRLLADRATRVALLQSELAKRVEVAEGISQSKDRFIAMLSHELRNPLSAIANAVAVLSHRRAGEQPPPGIVAILERQTRHLTFLVNDLLDMSKLATGKVRLDLATTDLAALVRDVIESMQAAGRFGDHAVENVLEPAVIRGDAERLEQVVRNLLDNAVKYTPAGGRIRVEVGSDAEHARIRVLDTGVGLDPAVSAQLFEPFVQADQELARSAGGLGLGLAIVRRIVDLHGGSVVAHSGGPGQGSEFVVTLPLDPPAAS